jgi:hydroxypyruvate isomerase
MKIPRRNFLQTIAAGAMGASLAPLPTLTAAESAKRRIKQSFTYGTFIRRGSDPAQVIKEAATLGYQSIEMGPREQWDRIRDAGLAIAIFIGHRSLSDGMNDKKNHDRIEKEMVDNFELAVKYKIPSILCLSGNRRGMPDEEGLDNTVACCKRIIKAAEDRQLTVCLELLNSKVDHPDYQCDRTTWGVEVCKRVNSPAMKLLYDIYHMQIMEGDLIRTIKKNIKYFGHFHTAGNPGRNNIDETQEIYYPAVMKAIADSGYTGYVGHEFSPKGDPLEAMRKTFQLCDV